VKYLLSSFKFAPIGEVLKNNETKYI